MRRGASPEKAIEMVSKPVKRDGPDDRKWRDKQSNIDTYVGAVVEQNGRKNYW
jgi:hypothetical protein